MRRPLIALATAAATALAGAGLAAAPRAHATPDLRHVMWVGNNWDGTATAVDADGTKLDAIATINVVPDKKERLAEIWLTPFRSIVYLSIQGAVGEGHDQMVDDMYTTPDGTHLVVSRPSFGDVVSIDLRTGQIAWRYEVAGWRADHMAVSPDGQKVVVSGSLSNKAFVLDIWSGRELGRYPTGDKPHESHFTADGSQIWTESIGNVNTSMDEPSEDWTKGKRLLTVVDAKTYKVLKNIDMRPLLDAAGRKDVSSAMRPMTVTNDDRYVYFQSSFFFGYSKYDMKEDKIVEVVDLPKTESVPARRQDYLLDSAEHGISLTPDDKHLCVAGTMANYATVVDPATGRPGPLNRGTKPYWITISGDGGHCVVSWSGDDAVSSIDVRTGEVVRTTKVGDHPQRVRLGVVPADWHGVG